jgi:hypothetical protein
MDIVAPQRRERTHVKWKNAVTSGRQVLSLDTQLLVDATTNDYRYATIHATRLQPLLWTCVCAWHEDTPAIRITADTPIAQLISTKDWSQTSLGPIGSWPATLISSVNAVLSSDQPVL